jgi:hypothetical protein
VLEAVKSRSFSPAAFSWLTMMVPGHAYAVLVGGQQLLKVGCLDQEGVAHLLGASGARLY